MSDFAQWMRGCGEHTRAAISRALPPATQYPQRLHSAMHYVASSGGKYFRPMLAHASACALELPREQITPLAVALELIHTYSLVHDDLPAMDNDDLRRGRPTCHKAYDEATAILTGDALQALALRILATDPALTDDPAARVTVIGLVAEAMGSRGMAGGQAVDVESEGLRLDAAALEAMHIHKTGALIRASVLATSHLVPDLDAHRRERLDHYAKCVGLAFQIHDDILDETATTSELGKTAGSDSLRAKNTYPALFGLSESKQLARGLIDDAVSCAAEFGVAGTRLRELADFVVSRRG